MARSYNASCGVHMIGVLPVLDPWLVVAAGCLNASTCWAVTLPVRTAKASTMKACNVVQYRGGPVTVAEFMREVLAHPQGGVYTANGAQAIGKQGHFVTSPEISSLFGEVWSHGSCKSLTRACCWRSEAVVRLLQELLLGEAAMKQMHPAYLKRCTATQSPKCKPLRFSLAVFCMHARSAVPHGQQAWDEWALHTCMHVCRR